MLSMVFWAIPAFAMLALLMLLDFLPHTNLNALFRMLNFKNRCPSKIIAFRNDCPKITVSRMTTYFERFLVNMRSYLFTQNDLKLPFLECPIGLSKIWRGGFVSL